MSDLYIDPSTRDLWIGDSGQTRLASSIPERAAQRITTALFLFRGEWFLDLKAGVPYYRDVFVKSPDLTLIRALFRNTVASDPDVVDVPRVDLDLDRSNRHLTIEIEARLRENSTLVIQPVVTIDGVLVVTSIMVTVNGVPIVVTA